MSDNRYFLSKRKGERIQFGILDKRIPLEFLAQSGEFIMIFDGNSVDLLDVASTAAELELKLRRRRNGTDSPALP